MRRWAGAVSVALLLVGTVRVAPAAADEQQRFAPLGDAAVSLRVDDGRAVTRGAPAQPARHQAPRVEEVLERAAARGYQDVLVGDAREHDAFAGDLTGDGRPDILSEQRSDDGEERLTLTARDGVDGSFVWSRTLPGVGYAYNAPVGADARGGAYVYQYPDDTSGWRFSAVAADGQIAWHKEFDAVPANTPITTGKAGLVSDFWFVDAVAGPATDLVVALWHYQDTDAGFLTTVEARVFDGATGELAITTTETALEHEPTVVPVDDMDGDGLADLVVAVYDYADSGSLSVRSGVTGLPLWHNPSAPLRFGYTTFDAAGDLDGDGRQELVASYEWWHDRWSYTLWGVVFAGATGLQDFDVYGAPYRLGDVDGDGDAELGVLQLEHNDEAFGAWIIVYNGNGAEVRREGDSFATEDLYDGGLWAQTVGDVDDDGVTDAEFSVWMQRADRTIVERNGVVNGASGAQLWTHENGWPLHTSIDGSGDDFIDLDNDYAAGVTHISPTDGATGRRLWDASVAGRHHLWDTSDVDRDGGDELLLEDGGKLTLLRSADGAVLWSD